MEMKDLSRIKADRIISGSEKSLYARIREMILTANPGKEAYLDQLMADGATIKVYNAFVPEYSIHNGSNINENDNPTEIQRLRDAYRAFKPTVHIALPKPEENADKAEENARKYKEELRTNGITFTYTNITIAEILAELGFEHEYHYDQYGEVVDVLSKLTYTGYSNLDMQVVDIDGNTKVVYFRAAQYSGNVRTASWDETDQGPACLITALYSEHTDFITDNQVVPRIYFRRPADTTPDGDKTGNELGGSDLTVTKDGATNGILKPSSP